jgi:hypothetical protein
MVHASLGNWTYAHLFCFGSGTSEYLFRVGEDDFCILACTREYTDEEKSQLRKLIQSHKRLPISVDGKSLSRKGNDGLERELGSVC